MSTESSVRVPVNRIGTATNTTMPVMSRNVPVARPQQEDPHTSASLPTPCSMCYLSTKSDATNVTDIDSLVDDSPLSAVRASPHATLRMGPHSAYVGEP